VDRVFRLYRTASSPVAVALLIGFNLVPLAGVLLWEWNAWSLLVLYWVENGIVGAFNIPKILLAAASPAGSGSPAPVGRPAISRAAIVPFFLLHYGMFWVVHGIFVLSLPLFLGLGELGRSFGDGTVPVLGPDGLPVLLADGADSGLRLDVVFWGGIGLAISHGASFFLDYVGRREYLAVTPQAQAQAPYGRVIVLHLAIIIGTLLSLRMGSPAGSLVILVVLKTAIDLALHAREHRVRPSADGPHAVPARG
jgi:hypothetical protein